MSYGINPIIYILIERAERELDSKLLTALFLIKKGFHVVLGQQWTLTLNKNCLPTGTFFFKGMNKVYTDNMVCVRQFTYYCCCHGRRTTWFLYGLAQILRVSRFISHRC